MAGGGGSIESGEPEFQIAPMIDVLLVLLIFFISITSMEVLRIDQDIALPVAEDAVRAQKERGEVILNVRYNENTRKARYNINADSRPIEATDVLITELTKAVDRRPRPPSRPAGIPMCAWSSAPTKTPRRLKFPAP